MAILASLFSSGVLGGIASAVLTFIGQIMTQRAQSFDALVSASTRLQSADTAAYNAAFARVQKAEGKDGARLRWALFGVAALVVGVCPLLYYFAPSVPMAVERVNEHGGWLFGLIPSWTEKTIEYVHGFYIAEVWQDTIANIVWAYVGQSITLKAFLRR